jgi:hypothetical protein
MTLDLDAIKARLAAACPGPWVGGVLRRSIDGNCYMLVREADPRTIAATLLPQYGDDATANMLLHAWGDVDALIAEVERLRAQRALDNDELARAYDMGRDKATAAVVAWLRERAARRGFTFNCPDELAWCADTIERGDHRREEKP